MASPSLKWTHDKKSGRHTLVDGGGWGVAALVARDDGQWDGYLSLSPLRFGQWDELKKAKASMKQEAARMLRASTPRWGSGIAGADALRELGTWLGEMSQQLLATAEAGAMPEGLAVARVHLGALQDVLAAVKESPSRDPVRAARLLAAEPIIAAAMVERRHRDKPWSDWLVSGSLTLLRLMGGATHGEAKPFAVVVARSAGEATDAILAIFRGKELYRNAPLQDVQRIAACSALDPIQAAPVAEGLDVSKLPRLDLRQPWRWPWR